MKEVSLWGKYNSAELDKTNTRVKFNTETDYKYKKTKRGGKLKILFGHVKVFLNILRDCLCQHLLFMSNYNKEPLHFCI